jgi:hypothetical protein
MWPPVPVRPPVEGGPDLDQIGQVGGRRGQAGSAITSCTVTAEKAELVAFRVGEDHPSHIRALTNVDRQAARPSTTEALRRVGGLNAGLALYSVAAGVSSQGQRLGDSRPNRAGRVGARLRSE